MTNQWNLFLFCSFLITSVRVTGQQLSLKAVGNEQEGYHINIYNDSKLLLSREGELSLKINNLDYTAEAGIQNWTGEKWEGNENSISLSRNSYIKDFDAELSIAVKYEIVNQHVIKKTISLFQPSMPGMYYTLTEKYRPASKPLKYVTFENDDFPGGFAHEMYPSAGFVTADGNVVGLLTDAGYKNQYTRNTRRRFSGRGGGFTGVRRLPDVNLVYVANATERKNNNDYISHTFGEMWNLDAGTSTSITIPSTFTKENASVDYKNNTISIKGNGKERSGIRFIPALKQQQVYTISFQCKGNASLALKLFRVKNGETTTELEDGLKYIDNFPVTENEWTSFKGSILVPYINDDSISLFIGTLSEKKSSLEIKDLSIVQHDAAREAYNVLPLGEKITKTTYLFVEPWKSHQQFMISSQSRLAEAKGFKGSLIEKMLYANLQMLTWITDTKDFTPLNVPNMNYAPDMYNRDSYFSAVATYNKELNLSLWEQWGKTQNAKGAIGTIITPLMGSVEAKGNEATIEWLMWALLNKRRFNATLPHDKIKKAVEYVLNEFDSTGDGICRSHFPLCQIDIIDFNPKTDRLAVNQGILAIALRTIKELGFNISEEHIEKAEQAYRNFYDKKRKHLLYDRKYPDLISLTDLEPEFYSLWLFNRPILTDEMVINHLEQIPVLNKMSEAPHPEYGTTAPLLVRLTKDKKGYAYLSKDYQPFEKFGEENYADGKNDGLYYNGGSWMRGEYCAYVAGLKHGWKKSIKLMENRVWAEIYLNPKWPFSKEFIPTGATPADKWWPSTKGLCWNVFILMANEVAGLRTPDMDPDYQKPN